jgi:tetratricopeptide (TPR) repeat protein
MRVRVSLAMVAATALALIAAARWATQPASASNGASATAPAAAGSSSAPADIALYERRAAEDPWSAADRAMLATLYLQRGRETGEYADFQRAEQSARASLKLRVDRNHGAMLVLASSLLAQHRFTEARTAAEALLVYDREQVGSRALLAEILLELGDYAAADAEFGVLQSFEENLAVAPRLARWHELHGRNDRARAILVRSLEQVQQRRDLPAEQQAWFNLRLADHALRNGRLTEADRAIASGLIANPGDYRLLSLRARVAAQRGEWKRALRDVEATGDRADLATLALGGDAAAALGRPAQALVYYDRVEAQARSRPEPFARQWTQFCLEHRRHLDETVTTLEAELKTRPDVLGHQLLAVAYQLTGRRDEARATMAGAMRIGTRDALLLYQAGRILGDPAYLRLARQVNSGVHTLPGSRVLN